MTQQPIQVQLRASDIANAIMQSVIDNQTTYMYLAAVLKELGGDQTVSVGTLEGLRSAGEWEVSMDKLGEDRIQFKLLEGSAKVNAALGRTPGGLIVPST